MHVVWNTGTLASFNVYFFRADQHCVQMMIAGISSQHPPGLKMNDTSPAKDSYSSHYQYTDPGITISVPEFSYGQREKDCRRPGNHDSPYVIEPEEDGGTEKGWDNVEGIGLSEQGKKSINALGGGKKMGFAQVVRETMLKEKGVSSISQQSVINTSYNLEGTIYIQKARR